MVRAMGYKVEQCQELSFCPSKRQARGIDGRCDVLVKHSTFVVKVGRKERTVEADRCKMA